MDTKEVQRIIGKLDQLENAVKVISVTIGDVTVNTADLEVLTGAVTETAPATDTASSGLNGRLQRIAQKLTTLIATAFNTSAKGATVAGSPTSRSKSADVTALDVQIVDAAGSPIVTFGSSTPTGDVADNAAQINLKPLYNGGKAVDVSSYAPAYTAGDAAGFAVSKDTGYLLVSSGFWSETIIAASTAASSNQTSSASNINGSRFMYCSLQLNATSLSAADGVIKLQDSNDGSNWADITGATLTVASGTSVSIIRDTAFTGKYARAVWTKGSNASGTLEVILMFKGS